MLSSKFWLIGDWSIDGSSQLYSILFFSYSSGNGVVPEVLDLTHLMNISQHRAAHQRMAAAAAAAASGGNTNGVERNPFLDLFMAAPQAHQVWIVLTSRVHSVNISAV